MTIHSNKNNALYVQAPIMTTGSNRLNLDGSSRSQYDFTYNLTDSLDKNNVDILNLNNVADKEKINRKSMFFKTDHHWTPEAAFWGYQKIIEELNKDYGCNIGNYYADINNFDKEIYKDWFLGSFGRRTGNLYSGLDDISLIYPKFETDIAFNIPSRKLYKRGSYKDVILNYDRIFPKNYYDNKPYNMYIGDDLDYVHFTNYNAPEKKSIVIVKDSFARPVSAFLSTCFENVHLIDVRLLKGQTATEVIEKIQPDIVMVLYGQGGSSKLFTNLL